MLWALLCPLAAVRFSPLVSVHSLNISHFVSNFNSIIREKSQNAVLCRVIVYIIRNRINGKCYVGHTGQTLEQRWYLHVKSTRNGSRFPLHCAIRKYGAEAFDKSQLASAPSLEELDALECRFIAQCNSVTPNGYNRTAGGKGFNGRHTKESRRKMSLSHTGVPTGHSTWGGKKLPEATVIKMAASRTGQKHNQQWKDNISEAIKRHWAERRRTA